MAWVSELLGQAGPLLTLAVVILVGVSFGGAARRVGLPGVTGQILAGVLMGHAGLALFDPAALDGHLQVLATLARTVGLGPDFQDQLFNSTSAAHASELLHGEEFEDFNYFLESPDDNGASR
jgi:hypothetical protein